MAGTTRTLEDVNISAEAAGLVRQGPTQVLMFSSSAFSEEYKLLELNKEVLENLESGDDLIIRGENQDDAVLCTPGKTYEIKAADTSNALLLVPQCCSTKDPGFTKLPIPLIERKVCGCHSPYYELKPCRPRLTKLKYLLHKNLYRGPEYESQQQEQKYSFEDLSKVVQASDDELRRALALLHAVYIEGYWRLMDTDYQERVFIRILTLLEEKDWSYDRVPLKECCDILEELEPRFRKLQTIIGNSWSFRRFTFEHCLKCYGERLDDMEVDDDESDHIHYRLLEDKVCKFYAEYLLRPAGRFNYHEFMESWQQSVPDGMTTSLEQLAGIALEDIKSHPPVIWHFPASDLPDNPELRFNKLFKTRPKWTLQEIQPYIKELEGPGQSLKALLLKYARSSKDASGATVYSSKKPLV